MDTFLHSRKADNEIKKHGEKPPCFSLSKNLHNFKNGVWGVAPSGVRAAAPHSAPFRGKGFGDRD